MFHTHLRPVYNAHNYTTDINGLKFAKFSSVQMTSNLSLSSLTCPAWCKNSMQSYKPSRNKLHAFWCTQNSSFSFSLESLVRPWMARSSTPQRLKLVCVHHSLTLVIPTQMFQWCYSMLGYPRLAGDSMLYCIFSQTLKIHGVWVGTKRKLWLNNINFV